MNITLIRHGKTKGNLEHRYIGTTDEPLCEEGIEEIKKIREAAKLESENLSDTEFLYASNKVYDLKSVPDIVFVSSMKRCIQTAEILFEQSVKENFADNKNLCSRVDFSSKDKYSFRETADTDDDIEVCKPSFCIVEAFREYDFGEFEGKNHEELMENESYRNWLESNGAYEMPAGEGLANFKNRVINAFDLTIKECLEKGYKNIVYVVHGGTIMAICEKYDTERKSYYDYMCKNGECYKAVWTDYLLKQVNK